MKKYYEFAGVEVEISAPEEIMYEDDRTLKPFVKQNVSAPHSFAFELVESLSQPEGTLQAAFPSYLAYVSGKEQIRYIGSVSSGWEEAYVRVSHLGEKHNVQLKKSKSLEKVSVKAVLNAVAAEHLVIEKNGVILHSSFIEYEGKGILFTAPSETGKSTQAELWAEHRGARIINGDRSVIRLIDGKPFACGIPFAGSSDYCENATLPLEAIVYLGQAPETKIDQFNLMEAFRKVWEGCTVNTWASEDLNRAIDIVQTITLQTPVYYLNCTPDESAVIALENALNLKEGR